MNIRIFFSFLLYLSLVCCVSNPAKNVDSRKIKNKDGQVTLLGKQNVHIFESSDFPWFQENYDAYDPDKKLLKKISLKLRMSNIIVFIATWDENSKTEFPKLIKILDEIKFPRQKIIIYSIDQIRKESFYGENMKYSVKEIPTVIIQRFQTETGRFICSPGISIENEIENILNNQPKYK